MSNQNDYVLYNSIYTVFLRLAKLCKWRNKRPFYKFCFYFMDKEEEKRRWGVMATNRVPCCNGNVMDMRLFSN